MRGRGGGIPTSSLGLEVGGGKARNMGANSNVITVSTVVATVSQYGVGATRSKQGMPSEKVLTCRLLKDATDINVDLGF
ncbi:hypothetical protein HAX54_025412 [Datura stramonium]|uniref:Uncharacterized protein n=1 Tax=Datura stramonium TaxID=4076 RepID=A0ABS8Y7Q5_DATST|nr:hypothetical protein [Datura stramonium]